MCDEVDTTVSTVMDHNEIADEKSSIIKNDSPTVYSKKKRLQKANWIIAAIMLALVIIIAQAFTNKNTTQREVAEKDIIIGSWIATDVILDGVVYSDEQIVYNTYAQFFDDTTATVTLLGKDSHSTWIYLDTTEGFRLYSLGGIHVAIDVNPDSSTYNNLILTSDKDDLAIFFRKAGE